MKPALAALAALTLVRCIVDASNSDTAAPGGAGVTNAGGEAGAGAAGRSDAGATRNAPPEAAGAADEHAECDAGPPPAGDRLYCNDGTASPCCTCSGSHRGCCSWHDGVAGCQPP